MQWIRFFILNLVFVGTAAFADGIPRCWTADQPGQDIVDGMYRIFLPTDKHSALDVAKVLAIVEQSMAAQMGVGTNPTLDHVEIDVYGDLSHWVPTGTFPTLESFKLYILASLQPLLTQPGVTVTCEAVNHPVPAPIEH